MAHHVRKAVFPVAGMGTRFLPATKANPKEMLPIVDKPLIQYAVEEAVATGITEMIFVTSSSKRAIEDHFDKSYELEAELTRRGREDLLSIVRNIVPRGVSCVYVRQPEALGLGHAVLCARPVVGKEPFAVILADDLIACPEEGAEQAGINCLHQMVKLFGREGCSILGVEEIAAQDTDKYGIVKTTTTSATNTSAARVEAIIEKPHPSIAPSRLAVVGRYILTPHIFTLLEQTGRGAGGEIQLTDAIARLLDFESVLAYRFAGRRYDCGTKLGYLEATVELGLRHQQLGAGFRAYLRDLAPSLKESA